MSKIKIMIAVSLSLLILVTGILVPMSISAAPEQDKVSSNVMPDAIWLRKTEIDNSQLYVVLKVRSNIVEVQAEDPDGKLVTQYEYDEVEIKYPVSVECRTAADIASYILDKSVDILALADVQGDWEAINASDVHNLRNDTKITKAEADLIRDGKLADVIATKSLILNK